MLKTLLARQTLLPDGLRPAPVVIEDGRIVAIGGPPRGEVIDLGDAVLMAALTDTHVHVNEPGRTEWEGFTSATQAAAAGGVTLLVDMPLNSDPVTTSLSALHAKIAAATPLWIDVALWGGIVPGNTDQLAPMVDAGVVGFKCFLCHSGIDDFPRSTATDLRQAMPVLRDQGVPLLVHAELEEALLAVPQDAAPRDYASYLHSRPKEAEDRAVQLIVELVRETGCAAHVVHLSSAGAVEILRRAKAEGLPVTAETCPHYLGLTAEEIPAGATAYKCSPPIRERDNQDQLWAALEEGVIDFVVTDHSPCIPSLKKLEDGDFLAAWGGIASLQLGLRSVWTQAQRRGIPLTRVAYWMSQAPAAFLGRGDRGRIAIGGAADLVAFHPDARSVVRGEDLLHRHPLTPWAGRELAGQVAATFLRGEEVHRSGVVSGPPRGRLVLGAHRA